MNHFFRLGGGHFIKMLIGFIYIKILSTYLSPKDFGNFSQVLTLVAVMSMLSLGGANNGIIKFLSSTKNSKQEWNLVFNKSLSLFLFVNIFYFVLLFFFANEISLFILNSEEYALLVKILSFTQVISAFGVFSSVYFTSQIDTKNSSLQTITNSLLFLLLLLFCVFFLSKTSLLFTSVYANFFAGIYGLFYFLTKKRRQILRSIEFVKIDFPFIKSLFGYAVVTISGAILWPVAQLYLRGVIGDRLGWDTVGYWFASAKISDAYIQFFSIFLLSYLYPRLTSLGEGKKARLFDFCKLYIPLVIASGSFIFLFSDFIVSILLGSDFSSSSYYVKLQVIGDVFKLVYSLFLIYMLSCGKIKYSIAVEFINSISCVIITSYLIDIVGWKAPLVGYISTQVITFVYVFYFSIRLKNK
ncbi:oligosaccharide flippase family protein [Aeromonas jandaei]|uniref:oligosaccharide flippase family protein n=1 Tax=Aeromonas jandaei TaxID=650 RepID=UPI003BA19AF4